MVDLFEETVDAPPAPPRRASRFGGIALFLALLPGLGLALNAVSPPGWGSPLGTLYALLTILPPIPAIALSVIGLFRDRRKWVAGVALALGLLPFAFLGYIAACT